MPPHARSIVGRQDSPESSWRLDREVELAPFPRVIVAVVRDFSDVARSEHDLDAVEDVDVAAERLDESQHDLDPCTTMAHCQNGAS